MSKYKYNAWFFQTEIRSPSVQWEVSCVLCYLLPFLLWSWDASFQLGHHSTSWQVLLVVSSILSLQGALGDSSLVWSGQDLHLHHFSIYKHILFIPVSSRKELQEGVPPSVLLTLWQFSASVCRHQELEGAMWEGSKTAVFYYASL